MLTGYVAKQVARTNRNLLVVNVVVLLCLLAILFAARTYVENCIHGPVTTTALELIKITDADSAPNAFVRLTVDPELLDGQAYHITGDKQNDWYQFLHVTPDRVLIIKANSQELPAVVEGSITDTSGDVEKMVVPAMAGDLHGSVGSIVLDTTSYRAGLYVSLAFAVPLAGWAIWNVVKAARRMGNPLLHPAVVNLAKIGPPEEIAIAVDAEIQAGATRVGKVLTTTSWLARPRWCGIDLVYLGDIAWAYKQEIKHKKYGVTVSKTYATVIHDVHGRQVTLSLNQKQVDALVADLAARVPWAYVGFDAKLKELWKSRRAQFLALVEERKQKVMKEPTG